MDGNRMQKADQDSAETCYFFSSPVRSQSAGGTISGRLYCTPKALWKLGWLPRNFLYDPELFGRQEIDENPSLGFAGW
jgi:hypothetical protein